ncbi:MAG TPA: hypothetical protein VGI52_02680, partial [Solirubrobacteraceae bacterium]
GGYGDPLSRDPEAVLKDVLELWVSLQAAAEVYGVVLVEQGTPAAGSIGYALDPSATESRRAQLREQRGAAGGN